MKRSFAATGVLTALLVVALPAGAVMTIDHLGLGSSGDGGTVVEAEAPSSTADAAPVSTESDSTTRRRADGPATSLGAGSTEPTTPPTRAEPPVPPTSRPGDTGPAPTLPTGAGPADIDREPTFRLQCQPRVADTNAVVHCEWTLPPAAGVAGYRVMRAIGTAPAVEIGRTPGQDWTDRDVAPGVRYVYGVQALDPAGNSLGRSNVAVVVIPAAVPQLRLGCGFRIIDTHGVVVCEWSPLERYGVRAYQLWRQVGDNSRQLLVTVGAVDGVRRFVDTDVRPGQNIRYVVIAIDSSGNELGRSEIVMVQIPAPPASTTVPSTTHPAEPSTTKPVAPSTSLAPETTRV